MERPFWSVGLRFACIGCHYCCRHEPGYVFLTRRDLDRLLAHTGLDEGTFIERYGVVVDLGIVKRISLSEKPGHDCVFWNDGCTVYEARPLQCRAYPFWSSVLATRDSWKEEGRYCPGIGSGPLRNREHIAGWLDARESEPLISLD